MLVVGGGASAVQFLGELAPVTDTFWVTRRPPVWRQTFDERILRDAIAQVQERVVKGMPPASVVSVTGIALREQEQEAARLGAYDDRRPMFDRIEPDGVRWDDPADGRPAFEPVDVILWATGFRPAVSRLARSAAERTRRIALLPGGSDVQASVTAARDPRVQLVGYGPRPAPSAATARGGPRRWPSVATSPSSPRTSPAEPDDQPARPQRPDPWVRTRRGGGTVDTPADHGPAMPVTTAHAALTPRQHEILEVIRDLTEDAGYPPTIREIGAAVGLGSPSSVHHHVRVLEAAGLVSRSRRRPRVRRVRTAGR